MYRDEERRLKNEKEDRIQSLQGKIKTLEKYTQELDELKKNGGFQDLITCMRSTKDAAKRELNREAVVIVENEVKKLVQSAYNDEQDKVLERIELKRKEFEDQVDKSISVIEKVKKGSLDISCISDDVDEFLTMLEKHKTANLDISAITIKYMECLSYGYWQDKMKKQ